jgi:hypothetical protein
VGHRALAQRVEVDQKELRIMGSKSVPCARWSPLKAQKTDGFGVTSFAEMAHRDK